MKIPNGYVSITEQGGADVCTVRWPLTQIPARPDGERGVMVAPHTYITEEALRDALHQFDQKQRKLKE